MPPKPEKSPPRPRRGLRRASEDKIWWRLTYLLQIRHDVAEDPMCRRCRVRYACEGHHPHGQQGAWIMVFWPFCRWCHDEVENDKKQARADGWITYK